jgi:hypothetical protein
MKSRCIWFILLAVLPLACRIPADPVTPVVVGPPVVVTVPPVVVVDSSAQTARQAQVWLKQPSRWQLQQMWFANAISPQRVLIYQNGQPLTAGAAPPNLQWMRVKNDSIAEFKYSWATQSSPFAYKVDTVANRLVLFQANVFNPALPTETWYVKPSTVFPNSFDMAFVSPGDSYTLSFSSVK